MTADTLPKFGGRIADAESAFDEYMTDFSVEMFRCSRCYENAPQEVKLLHISMDLDAMRHETDKIIQRMKDEGFDVKHKIYQNPKFSEEWAGSNILILGNDDDHPTQAYTFLQLIDAGLLSSVVLGWDVLLYDVNAVSDPKLAKRPAYLPRNINCDNILWSDRRFSLKGICLAHAHIRRRNDVTALRGLVADAMMAIESDIDDIMGEEYKKKNGQDPWVSEKVKQLRNKIEQNRGSIRQAELFFAAVDVLRESRNVAMHISQSTEAGSKKLKNYMGASLKFDRLARKYDFNDKRGLDCNIANLSVHEAFFIRFKWLVFLAKMSRVWLGEYIRR